MREQTAVITRSRTAGTPSRSQYGPSADGGLAAAAAGCLVELMACPCQLGATHSAVVAASGCTSVSLLLVLLVLLVLPAGR